MPDRIRSSDSNKHYFLGVDVGGSKTHALIADADGRAVGFAHAGPGNWESVGYDGLTAVLKDVIYRSLAMTGTKIERIAGAGMGLAGYDWPSQKQAHLDAISPLGLEVKPIIVNDTVLGIVAGSEQGWGVSVVSGTGCNCRGLSKDHQREGRVVGGGGGWSGEAAGGFDILYRAMREVTFDWAQRGPVTALSPAFLRHIGAKDLDDLIEGIYVNRYNLDSTMTMMVFEIARQGDPQALEVMSWAGSELGGMATGVIKQLTLQDESFDVVLIGSIFDGHPLITESMAATIHSVAPKARLVRLSIPPVVGGVLLGMEAAGMNASGTRPRLIKSTEHLLKRGENNDHPIRRNPGTT